jgi:hypothetical protein
VRPRDAAPQQTDRTDRVDQAREAGVIRQERRATAKLTQLRREDLDARFPGLLDAVLSSKPVAA